MKDACLRLLVAIGACGLAGSPSVAAPYEAQLVVPLPASSSGFRMGESRSPDGSTVEVDSRSLLRDGRRWVPVMGEFHFARYPENEWREELAKMRAGGIDIVATYVFWIHHEEEEGVWDWSGRRSLRDFIRATRDTGMLAVVRCGPWCHGEARNGGTPDWVLRKGWRVRSNDPAYLAASRELFAQIARQLDGLLWKHGGPVIGIQLENEYGGPAEHLLALKRLAREVGLDVPLYTRTGWPATRTPMPFGEVLPLFGGYAEGFWDRSLAPMPGRYWQAFRFQRERVDENIANEQLQRDAKEEASTAEQYPYLTCEIGGGMMSAYHRRIRIDPRDVEAVTLVKLGSGSNLLGYYMYHGGVHPDGKLSPMMEDQARNWNDMPQKNYDFQAPLGQYGQVRPHYYRLRRLHHFLRNFGPQLAETEAVFPNARRVPKGDTATLRWAVRSDGRSGFVFVNNYERLEALPAKEGVQFSLKLADGETRTFPARPITVPSDGCFIWPFNMALSRGVELAWATAQPICFSDETECRTCYFAETPGVAAEFAIAESAGEEPVLHRPPSSRTPFVVGAGKDGRRIQIVLLDEADSLRLCQESAGGPVGFDLPPQFEKPIPLVAKLVRPAGPAREVPLGKARQPVAAAPTDADFEHAAVWQITLPADLDDARKPLVRFHYVGDVARVMIGGRLIVDDFYNGLPLEIGLDRHAEALAGGTLHFALLPLRRDAPIGFSPPETRPDFQGRSELAELQSVELIYRVALPASVEESSP